MRSPWAAPSPGVAVCAAKTSDPATAAETGTRGAATDTGTPWGLSKATDRTRRRSGEARASTAGPLRYATRYTLMIVYLSLSFSAKRARSR
jgi:hypothetical protein